MALDVTKVYVPKPDQKTTGAVASAPVGTAGPTTAREQLTDSAWVTSGYVDENGVTMAQDRSTTNLKDWSGSNVRVMLDEFTGTVQYTEMETSQITAERMVGADNVTVTPATAEHGEQLNIALGPNLPGARAWVFSMIDEDRFMRIYIPNGEVTSVDSTTFTRNDAVKWNYTITANDDGTGHSIYILTDDGAVVTNSLGGE